MWYREKKIEVFIAKAVGKRLAVIVYVAFAVVIVLFEEVLIALIMYRIQKEIMKMSLFDMKFRFFSPGAKLQYSIYFNAVAEHHSRRMIIMAREASIQVVYQITIVLYEYFDQPLFELNYQNSKFPTATWRAFMVLRLVSLFLSAFSTFMPLLEDFNMTSFRRCNRPVSFSQRIVKIAQILLHILIGTSLLFLSRSPINLIIVL